jgi:uncharacterized membrane protein YidH (DUF202 family)
MTQARPPWLTPEKERWIDEQHEADQRAIEEDYRRQDQEHAEHRKDKRSAAIVWGLVAVGFCILYAAAR